MRYFFPLLVGVLLWLVLTLSAVTPQEQRERPTNQPALLDLGKSYRFHFVKPAAQLDEGAAEVLAHPQGNWIKVRYSAWNGTRGTAWVNLNYVQAIIALPDPPELK